MKKGIFIAVYGINNIGKTTHCKRLVNRLKKLGKDAVYIKYPVYGQKPTGLILNKILRASRKQKITEEELQLWFVLNRYQFQPSLKKMLEKGKIIIAEDYIGTGLAWGRAKGANLKELESMNKFLVQSDVAILMDGSRAMSAKEKSHIHEQNDRLAEECRRIYQKLAKKYGWKIIKVSPDTDVTAARLWKAHLVNRRMWTV